jgi:hypothetical protein
LTAIGICNCEFTFISIMKIRFRNSGGLCAALQQVHTFRPFSLARPASADLAPATRRSQINLFGLIHCCCFS